MHGILERFYSNGVCDLGAASPLLGMAACASLAAGLVLGASQAHATINYSAVTSTNWAGYVATAPRSQAFTGVVGAWQVPAVTAPPAGSSSGTYSAFWVGLDGFTNGTVEQLGTSSFSTPGNGSYYYAWYEMYPQFSIPIGMAVTPGDWMNASVTYEGGANFRLTMQDTTTGAIFSIDQTSTFDQGQFASSDLRTSAEWIAERNGPITDGLGRSVDGPVTIITKGAVVTGDGQRTAAAGG